MKYALVVVGLLTSACVTTREEGEALKRDMAALKGELASVQREESDRKTQDHQKLEDIGKRVAELETTLATLRQADADAGVQLDKVTAEVQTLRGDVEQAKHGLEQQQATVAEILAHPPAAVAVGGATAAKVEDDPKKPVVIGGVEVPADAKPHYDMAKKLYDEKKYQDAADAFDLFLRRHESDAPDYKSKAAYWKAEAIYQNADDMKDKEAKKKALKQAILAYQTVLQDPKSEKADIALWKVGLAFEQLEYKDEATTFFDELVTKYPKSSFVAEAKKHLKALGGKKKGR